jgi:hypothetical protein
LNTKTFPDKSTKICEGTESALNYGLKLLTGSAFGKRKRKKQKTKRRFSKNVKRIKSKSKSKRKKRFSKRK